MPLAGVRTLKIKPPPAISLDSSDPPVCPSLRSRGARNLEFRRLALHNGDIGEAATRSSASPAHVFTSMKAGSLVTTWVAVSRVCPPDGGRLPRHQCRSIAVFRSLNFDGNIQTGVMFTKVCSPGIQGKLHAARAGCGN